MKTLIFLVMTTSLIHFNSDTLTEVQAIQQTITEFIKAGDNQNTKKMESLLDANYRVVMNQLFGSSEVSILPRAVYLEKIQKKEFGGDQRQITFEQITVNGNTASVQVYLKGQKMSIRSLYSLIKNSSDKWQIISDMPVVQ